MITSEEDLLNAVSEIAASVPPTSLLLFRGQTALYENMRSGKARPDAFVVNEVENGWNTIVNRLTGNVRNSKYNQSILQHYGFPTYYLDLTSDALVAAWFATHNYVALKPPLFIGNTFRMQDEVMYEAMDDGTGFFIVLEIPNYQHMIAHNELFDIRHDHKFIRPKRQAAFLMLDQPPRMPNPNEFVKRTLEIDRRQFKSSKTTDELFPGPKEDKGYGALLDVPYVQLPAYYFSGSAKTATDNTEDENPVDAQADNTDNAHPSIDLNKFFIVGRRAIHIPLYLENKEDIKRFNPKWNDFVIFEPSVFRLWKTEDFDISSIHGGQPFRFGDTAKITITPQAYDHLFKNETTVELAWPDINSDSIFFTRSVLDHDKVIDHAPPYLGIWLHKKDNLIFEIHLIVDEDDDTMRLELGHAYVLENGVIEYAKVQNECKCGNPEQHFRLIKALLSIHGLQNAQSVALIQNPFKLENWYILL